MGMKRAWQFKGLDMPDCYHMIWQCTFDKPSSSLTAVIARYVSKDARISNLDNFLEVQTYNGIAYDPAGPNKEITTVYSYLETLPEYEGFETI